MSHMSAGKTTCAAVTEVSPAAFTTKVRTLSSMLYNVPHDVADTFHADNDTQLHDVQNTTPAAEATTPPFMLTEAETYLTRIMRDLGLDPVTDAETVDDKRLTVRLRAQLDALSLTLTGSSLPVLTTEQAMTSDGASQTNMRSLCQHVDGLIHGLKGNSIAGDMVNGERCDNGGCRVA